MPYHLATPQRKAPKSRSRHRISVVQRIAILGCGGAGKSTLARALARPLGLPVVYLDRLFWEPGWQARPEGAARAALDEAVQAERWVLDGNFLLPRRRPTSASPGPTRSSSSTCRGAPACAARSPGSCATAGAHGPTSRTAAAKGFDLAFLRWIWSYPTHDRPRVLRLLDELDRDVAVHRLRSPVEVRRFLYGSDREAIA